MAAVSERSQLSRSAVSPAEQVGEHQAGAGGWRAWAGNGGISAGATDEAGNVLAQPPSHISSGSSIAPRGRSSFVSVMGYPFDCFGPCVLKSSCCFAGQRKRRGLFGHHLCNIALGDGSARAPPAASAHQQGHGDASGNE